MDTPIYSTYVKDGKNQEFNSKVTKILFEKEIEKINKALKCSAHGIYIFIQYQEKEYIVNGYPEQVFWNIVSRLYALLHDCGRPMLKYFMQIVNGDGLATLKPFPITPNEQISTFVMADDFISILENLRHYEQHNMKSESSLDKTKEKNCMKWFNKITGEDKPSSQKSWESCINQLIKNADNIYNLLWARINLFESSSSKTQQGLIINRYYSLLEDYYKTILIEVLFDLNKKKRLNLNSSYLLSIAKEKDQLIIDEAIKLLKKATIIVDPYKVILQASETYLIY